MFVCYIECVSSLHIPHISNVIVRLPGRVLSCRLNFNIYFISKLGRLVSYSWLQILRCLLINNTFCSWLSSRIRNKQQIQIRTGITEAPCKLVPIHKRFTGYFLEIFGLPYEISTLYDYVSLM